MRVTHRVIPTPADKRDAKIFAVELADLVRRGLITVEDRDDHGVPLRFGIAGAIADIEAGRV